MQTKHNPFVKDAAFFSFLSQSHSKKAKEKEKIDLQGYCASSQADIISNSSHHLTCDCTVLGRCGTKITYV